MSRLKHFLRTLRDDAQRRAADEPADDEVDGPHITIEAMDYLFQVFRKLDNEAHEEMFASVGNGVVTKEVAERYLRENVTFKGKPIV